MVSDIEKLLINLGVENSVVQIVISFIIGLTLAFTVVRFIKKASSWIFKKYVERKASKDLHPFFSRVEVENATKNFIKTRFQNIPPSQDEEPGRNYIASAKQELIPLFVDRAFDESKDDDKYYIILADSGMGKTTFMINLFLEYKYGLRWPWIKRHEIKLLPLGNPNAITEIERIEDRENTILLLDAFDEDNLAVKNYSERLNEIIKLTWNFRDVVITCRTQFFPDSKSEPYETGRLKFGPKGGIHRFKKLYISVFSQKDIKKYLGRKFSFLYVFKNKKYFKASAIVLLSPNLMIRPMLLSNIEYLVDRSAKYRFSFQIYRTLIDEWLDRESRKPGIISKFENPLIYKRALYDFSIKLAKNVYRKNDQVQRKLGVVGMPSPETGFTIEELTLDVAEQTSRSLLNRNAEGDYKFSHKSVYEYFLAVIVLEDAKFRENFYFEENLDACRQFFNDMRRHDFLYRDIQIDPKELVNMNAVSDAWFADDLSKYEVKERSAILEVVSSSLKTELIKRIASFGVLGVGIIALVAESIAQAGVTALGIELSRFASILSGTVTLIVSFTLFFMLKYSRIFDDIKKDHQLDIDEE